MRSSMRSAASWTVVMLWALSSSTLILNSSSSPITISTYTPHPHSNTQLITHYTSTIDIRD
uniref:Uncharacterized protein n=1 Tax=Cucumis melo TaxID=3656 RepID=A0A9I9EKV2_CUCME